MQHATYAIPSSIRPDRGGSAVAAAWVLLAAVLSALWLAGHFPNGDVDDILKAIEIRHLLDTGSLFDRTLPQILQPEPFASHWPWIVDAPYAAAALVSGPFLGREAGLQFSFFAVPLLLLAPTLFFLRRIVGELGFDRPDAVFALSVLCGLRAFAEFQPGRIDYHNLQMLLLVAAVFLLMRQGKGSALLNGTVTALALAIGLELAVSFLLVIGIYAIDHIAGREGSARRLIAFGLGLSAGAGMLYLMLVAPADYGVAVCDRYSAPHALALTCAGISFMIASALPRHVGWTGRLACLAVLTAVSAIIVAVLLYPECLGGPYAGLSDYVRTHWLAQVQQEKTLFARPDFVLSGDMLYTAAMFLGAGATLVAACAQGGRSRPWMILALFALVALLHTLFYFRYLRFLPLLSGPGIAVILGSLLSPGFAKPFQSRIPGLFAGKFLPVLPGSAVVVLVVAVAGLLPPRPRPLEGADLASSCDVGVLGHYSWPGGSRVLTPPGIAVRLLANSNATVVAVPFHPSAKGIERSLRFFDPATQDSEAILTETRGTHVAVCRWNGDRSADLEQAYPLTVALMEGRPPAWLRPCPGSDEQMLRIYVGTDSAGDPEECPSFIDMQ